MLQRLRTTVLACAFLLALAAPGRAQEEPCDHNLDPIGGRTDAETAPAPVAPAQVDPATPPPVRGEDEPREQIGGSHSPSGGPIDPFGGFGAPRRGSEFPGSALLPGEEPPAPGSIVGPPPAAIPVDDPTPPPAPRIGCGGAFQLPRAFEPKDSYGCQVLFVLQLRFLFGWMTTVHGYPGATLQDFVSSFKDWEGYASLSEAERAAYDELMSWLDELEIYYHYRPTQDSGGIVDHGEIFIGGVRYSFGPGKRDGGPQDGYFGANGDWPTAGGNLYRLTGLTRWDKLAILLTAVDLKLKYDNWFRLTAKGKEETGPIFEYDTATWNCFQFAAMLLNMAPSVDNACDLDGCSSAEDVADRLVDGGKAEKVDAEEEGKKIKEKVLEEQK